MSNTPSTCKGCKGGRKRWVAKNGIGSVVKKKEKTSCEQAELEHDQGSSRQVEERV